MGVTAIVATYKIMNILHICLKFCFLDLFANPLKNKE